MKPDSPPRIRMGCSGPLLATDGEPVHASCVPFGSRVTMVASLSTLMFGYSLTVLNPISAHIASTFDWCAPSETDGCARAQLFEASINSSLFAGAAVGAWLFGTLLGRFSCSVRIVLCISSVCFILGGICAAASNGVAMLIVGRVLSGIGVGLSVGGTAVYIASLTRAKERGFYISLTNVSIQCGALIGDLSGFLPECAWATEWTWRAILCAPIITAGVQLLILLTCFAHDAPEFLVARSRDGDEDRAVRVLQRMHGDEESTLSALESTRSATRDNAQVTRIPLWPAFGDNYFGYGLKLGILIAAMQNLTGINAILAYTSVLLKQGGVPTDSIKYGSLGVTLVCVLTVFLTSFIVDRWGRRKLLLLGTGLQAGGLLCSVLINNLVPSFGPVVHVIGLCLFCAGFNCGLGPITWVYLGEIFPMEIRSSAIGLAGIVNWTSSFLAVFLGGFLSADATFLVFGIMSAIGFLAFYKWLLETSGCSPDDSPVSPRSLRSRSPVLRSHSMPERPRLGHLG